MFIFCIALCFASVSGSSLFGNSDFVAELFNRKSQILVEKSRYLDHYDFIIVGSGPGGCVLANRLTENTQWNVLLIEAGKVETLAQRVPVMAAYMQSTAYNWGFVAERQDGSCLGMDEQRCGFPRGKALGGSSVINYMIYNRGNRDDFDRWAAAGNEGWSWREVLPFFKKSERATGSFFKDPKAHNKNGWLNVEENQHKTRLVKGFVDAMKQLGQKEIDYNSGDQIGVSFLQANTQRGRRHSAYRAFIEPILSRSNLHIMVNTRVTKILIDPKNKAAYGVEFIRNRKKFVVTARKEVILSAGTFGSPQLLMLSGVGHKGDLSRLGINVIQDLPVGKIMYDHVSHLGPTFVVNTTGESLNAERALSLPSILSYVHGRGSTTIPGGVEALSFVKTKSLTDRGPNVPDVELLFVSGGYHSDEGAGIKRGLRMTDEIYNKVFKQLEDTSIDTFSIMQVLFHPTSFGYIELKSANPFHWPKFYHNFFQHPSDLETVLEGLKHSLKIAQTPAMRKLGARLHSVPLPNCAHIHFGSDDYWRCSIRTLSSTLHHQISTCKMGPVADPTAVVSNELKVHGIRKLRVVDTSIIPEPITAHTNAASYMIGEKAADMIKRQWRGD